jgi:hypothetical protein
MGCVPPRMKGTGSLCCQLRCHPASQRWDLQRIPASQGGICINQSCRPKRQLHCSSRPAPSPAAAAGQLPAPLRWWVYRARMRVARLGRPSGRACQPTPVEVRPRTCSIPQRSCAASERTLKVALIHSRMDIIYTLRALLVLTSLRGALQWGHLQAGLHWTCQCICCQTACQDDNNSGQQASSAACSQHKTLGAGLLHGRLTVWRSGARSGTRAHSPGSSMRHTHTPSASSPPVS